MGLVGYIAIPSRAYVVVGAENRGLRAILASAETERASDPRVGATMAAHAGAMRVADPRVGEPKPDLSPRAFGVNLLRALSLGRHKAVGLAL